MLKAVIAMSELIIKTASEFCKKVTDGTHDSPKKCEEGYFLVTSKHLGEFELDFNSSYKISEEDYKKIILRSNVEQWDILFSMIGTVGNVYQEKGEKIKYAIKNVGLFKMGGDVLKSKWLNYYIKSPLAKEYFNSNIRGTTQGYVTLDTLRKFPILYPESIKMQTEIVETLSSMDNMIELNNRTGKVLDEMSQVLYKSWFVNFDFPNQEGKPYKLSGGEMVESEIGLIPKGWKIAELGDVTTNLREKTKSNDYKVLSAVNTGNLMLSEDYFTKQVFSKDLSKYIIVKQKDFAYNPARVNIGSIGMNEFDFDGCVSPVYVAFRPEEGYHWFFHIYVKSNNFNDEVNKRASGSVRQALNYGDFALIKIAYPPKSVIDKFNDFYEEAYLSQKEIKQETQTLINLRDTLLPKLMSGELMVPCEEEI